MTPALPLLALFKALSTLATAASAVLNRKGK